MGTRSGDVDPGLFAYLGRVAGLDAGAVTDALNSRSGLLGLSGHQQRHAHASRPRRERATSGPSSRSTSSPPGSPRRSAALAVPLERLDALVFTGGIGEHSASRPPPDARPPRRPRPRRGRRPPTRRHGRDTGGRVSPPGPPVALVVPTDEELMIARDTAALVGARLMGRTLLVVPTGPSVGLTSTCLGLLRALDRRGVSVGFVKPLAQPHPHGPPRRVAGSCGR